MEDKKKLEEQKKVINFFNNLQWQFASQTLYKNFINAVVDMNDGEYEKIQYCEIFEIIDKVMGSSDGKIMKRIIPENTKFYRAREISVDDYKQNKKGISMDVNYIVTGYDEINSKEAPIGVSSAGRNNIYGMPYLYVAEDEVTACVEIKPDVNSLISLAEFQTKVPLTVIDFSQNKEFSQETIDDCGIAIGDLITKLMFEYSRPAKSERDYRATQLMSDYFRKMGVDGICYKSFYTWKENFTFFNCHNSLIKFVSSRIIMHQYRKDVFYDINEKKILESIDEEIAGFNNEETIKEKLEKIRKKFNES